MLYIFHRFMWNEEDLKFSIIALHLARAILDNNFITLKYLTIFKFFCDHKFWCMYLNLCIVKGVLRFSIPLVFLLRTDSINNSYERRKTAHKTQVKYESSSLHKLQGFTASTFLFKAINALTMIMKTTPQWKSKMLQMLNLKQKM